MIVHFGIQFNIQYSLFNIRIQSNVSSQIIILKITSEAKFQFAFI